VRTIEEYNLKSEERLKASIRARLSLWLAAAAFVGWVLSRLTGSKRRNVSMSITKDNHPLEKARPAGKSKPEKAQGGLLSLVLELLGAVAIRLGQRYFKAWRSELLARIEDPPDLAPPTAGLPDKTAPKDGDSLPDYRNEVILRDKTDKPYSKGVVALFQNTAKEWIQDKCPQLGASLAYFTVFSLAPLVLVLLAIFGLVYGGSDHARQKITEQLQYLIDPSGIKVIQDIAANTSKTHAGILATTIGIVLALSGASGVFGQLQDALNTIWGVKPKPGGGIKGFIRTRFLSFAMVGGVCFLLLASLTIETILSDYLKNAMPGGHIVALGLFLIFDFAVIVLLFAMIFRFLPDAKIAWRDVWVGATLTAILFALGKFVLGLYLGSGAAGSAYGAASSLITLLLWIYYAAQILLFGAEFTQVYANTYGTRVEPEEYAVKIEITERVVAA
jgi:membrane protein